MSNTYADATGVLLFDGPARVTPVIEMLFAPFNLNAERPDSDDQCYIDVLSEESDPTWEGYLDQLTDAMPEGQRINFANHEKPAEVLIAMGEHFGADLEAFAAAIDFDDSVNITDVARLAQLLSDGHNLIGLSMEGAWHSDSARLWEFGGWAVQVTPRCRVDLSTADVMHFARELDAALAMNVLETAGTLDEWLKRFINGIADESMRDYLRLRYALPETPSASSDTAHGNWSRTIYVGAHATDDGNGPEWARIEVTPEFIARVKALRAACRLQRLSEVCMTDSPAAWGQGAPWNRMPLSKPRLVVTEDAFWYTADPIRRVCAFESYPLAVNWLIETITSDGAPLYRRIKPDALNG